MGEEIKKKFLEEQDIFGGLEEIQNTRLPLSMFNWLQTPQPTPTLPGITIPPPNSDLQHINTNTLPLGSPPSLSSSAIQHGDDKKNLKPPKEVQKIKSKAPSHARGGPMAEEIKIKQEIMEEQYIFGELKKIQNTRLYSSVFNWPQTPQATPTLQNIAISPPEIKKTARGQKRKKSPNSNLQHVKTTTLPLSSPQPLFSSAIQQGDDKKNLSKRRKKAKQINSARFPQSFGLSSMPIALHDSCQGLTGSQENLETEKVTRDNGSNHATNSAYMHILSAVSELVSPLLTPTNISLNPKTSVVSSIGIPSSSIRSGDDKIKKVKKVKLVATDSKKRKTSNKYSLPKDKISNLELTKDYNTLHGILGPEFTRLHFDTLFNETGGRNKIKGLIEYSEKLIENGYTLSNIIYMGGCNGGAKNLKAVSKYHGPLSEKDFTKDHIRRMVSMTGGHSNLEAVHNNIELLRKLDFINSKIVALVSMCGGYKLINVIIRLHFEIKKYGIKPEVILRMRQGGTGHMKSAKKFETHLKKEIKKREKASLELPKGSAYKSSIHQTAGQRFMPPPKTKAPSLDVLDNKTETHQPITKTL